jgi:hypothetical protein
MEEGGRKEIAMMVPNVNLYLSNSPGRAAQEEADNMSQMERTIRGTIAWKFAPIGDAIPRRRAQDPRRGAHRG